jgi:hypothetical protein
MAGRRMKRESELSAGDAGGQGSERYENENDASKAVMGHAHGFSSCSIRASTIKLLMCYQVVLERSVRQFF